MQHDPRDAVAALVPRGTFELLDRYVALLIDEAARQNLIAASTVATIWSRHILDSLQLVTLAPAGLWLDIGSGAGLPGIPVAIAEERPTLLVEPRTRRAAFLDHVVETLCLRDRVQICAMRIERLQGISPSVISARAVASLPQIFAMAEHLSTIESVWLLPKGRSVRDELAAARLSWQGVFELVPSCTDPEAAIVVARQVHRRKTR